MTESRKGSIPGARSAAAALAALLGLGAGAVQASPLDFLLTARPELAGTRQAEVAFDAINDTLDVFNIRGNDPVYAGTSVGDYEGAHLRLGFAPVDRWWIDGALWARKLEYPGETGSISSWSLAAQYRLAGPPADAIASAPSWAIRASLWGNRSGTLNKNSPTQLLGYTLDTVSIDEPRDLQLQLDLIGSIGGPDAWFSWFGGLQRSKIDYSSLSGTATRGTCPYDISFGSTATTLTQTADCDTSSGTVLAGAQITVDNAAAGIDPQGALAYTANVIRLGANGFRRWGPWHLRGGVLYEYFDRGDEVEQQANQLSGVYHSSNLSLSLEAGYRVAPGVVLFVRGTAWQHQLMGEVPFLYNGVTAKRSDREYGLVSFGVSAAF